MHEFCIKEKNFFAVLYGLAGCDFYLHSLNVRLLIYLKTNYFLLLWETDGMSGIPLTKRNLYPAE